MFRCADAEQMQATGEHRPGGLGKGQPGTVGGQGFLLAARQGRARVMKAEEAVGDSLEMPGEPVGSAVAGGGFDEPGVVGDRRDQRDFGGMAVGPVRTTVNPELPPIPDQGPYAGVGVPHAEERIALALGEEPPRLEIGQIMRGGP